MSQHSVTASESDEWATPAWFFAACAALYGPYQLDAAAHSGNNLCPAYFSLKRSALAADTWAVPGARRAWCNPPYSKPNLELFTARARREVEQSHLELVSCLIPMSTSALWWHENVERLGDAITLITSEPSHPLGARTLTQTRWLDIEVLRVRGRLAFDGAVKGTARFHSVVVTFARPGLLKPLVKHELRGRPSEFTEAQREHVEALLAAGHSQSTACRLAGVNRRTWYRHKEKHHA